MSQVMENDDGLDQLVDPLDHWLIPALRHAPVRRRTATRQHETERIDFDAINQRALGVLPSLLKRWFPRGVREGDEWKLGSRGGEAGKSFSINLKTGRWADFAEDDDSGGDVVSYYAYIKGLPQGEAAKQLKLEMEELNHDNSN